MGLCLHGRVDRMSSKRGSGGGGESGNLESEANYDNLSTKTLQSVFGL